MSKSRGKYYTFAVVRRSGFVVDNAHSLGYSKDILDERGFEKMIQTVGTWGNNLAIRIPKNVSLLKKGQLVEVLVGEDMIQIIPVKKRRSIAELRAASMYTEHPGNLVDFGPDVGKEIIND